MDNRRDDVLLYAFGLLDPEARADVEAYLERGGPRAAGELAEAKATLALLAQSPEPVEPPRRIKDALLTRTRGAEPSLRLIRGEGCLAPSQNRRVSRWTVALGSAAATAVLMFLGVQQSMAGRVQRLERVLIEQESTRGRLEASAAALEIVRSRRPEVQVIDLQGPALYSRGFARIYQNWQTGDCYLYVRGLRRAERDQYYQVWFTTMEGELAAGGQLRPDASGIASVLTRLPRDVDVGAPIIVTLEPRDTLTPGGAPQLVGELRL